jgi:hypothetical protein
MSRRTLYVHDSECAIIHDVGEHNGVPPHCTCKERQALRSETLDARVDDRSSALGLGESLGDGCYRRFVPSDGV